MEGHGAAGTGQQRQVEGHGAAGTGQQRQVRSRLEPVRLGVDLQQRVRRLGAADEGEDVHLAGRHDGGHRRAARTYPEPIRDRARSREITRDLPGRRRAPAPDTKLTTLGVISGNLG